MVKKDVSFSVLAKLMKNNHIKRLLTSSFLLVLIAGLFMGSAVGTNASVVSSEEYIVDPNTAFTVFSGGSVYTVGKGGLFTHNSNSNTFLFGINCECPLGNIITGSSKFYSSNVWQLESITCTLNIAVLNDEGFDEPNVRQINGAFRKTDSFGQAGYGAFFTDNGDYYTRADSFFIQYGQDGGISQSSQLVNNRPYSVQMAQTIYFTDPLIGLSPDDIVKFVFTNFQAVGDPYIDPFLFRVNSIIYSFNFVNYSIENSLNDLNNGINDNNQSAVDSGQGIVDGWRDDYRFIVDMEQTWSEKLDEYIAEYGSPEDVLNAWGVQIDSLEVNISHTWLTGVTNFLMLYDYIAIPLTLSLILCFVAFLLRSLL